MDPIANLSENAANVFKYGRIDVDKSIHALINNTRYEHVKFEFTDKDFSENPQITDNIRLILDILSGSITCIETTHDIQQISDLPQLTELIFSDRGVQNDLRDLFDQMQGPKKPNLFSDGLLSKTKMLEVLKIYYDDLSEASETVLKEYLKGMDNLKELKIINASFLNGWKHEDYKFKLEVFHFYGFSDDQKKICVDFLKEHRSTLKEVYFHQMKYEDVLFILNTFPNLSKLHITKYVTNGNETYPIHENVKILKFDDRCVKKGHPDIPAIFQGLPNLEIFEIGVLTGSVLDVIFQKSSMKIVRYVQLEDVESAQSTLMTDNPQIEFIKADYPDLFKW